VNDEEWDVIAGSIGDWFQGDFTPETADNYAVVLKRFDREAVALALEGMVEQGRVFVPKPGEIIEVMRKATEDPVPSWTEAWDLLMKAVRIGGRKYHDGPKAKQEKAVAWLEERSPIVAAFFDTEGWASMALTEWDDPEWGGARRKQVKDRWDEFVGVAQERLQRGLALQAGGRRELGPRTLDAAALIERLRPEEPKELPSGE
jgi:hypothetical protein